MKPRKQPRGPRRDWKADEGKAGDRNCVVVDWSDRIVPYEVAWRLQQVIVQLQQLRLNHVEPSATVSEDTDVCFGQGRVSHPSGDRRRRLELLPGLGKPGQGRTPCDYVLLLQHPPVYTIGQGGTPANVLFQSEVRELRLPADHVSEMQTVDGCRRLLSRLVQEAEEAPRASFHGHETGPENDEGQADVSVSLRPSFGDGLAQTPGHIELESWRECGFSEGTAGRRGCEDKCREERAESAAGLTRGLEQDGAQTGRRGEAPTVWRVERGGEVTYHAPGQLVLYPLLDLRYHSCDLRWYIQSLEQIAINTVERLFRSDHAAAEGKLNGPEDKARHVGVGSKQDRFSGPEVERGPRGTAEGSSRGYRRLGTPGVWLQGEKVCAVGVKVKRWITHHGLALNVCTDLSGFHKIVPCGLRETTTGRLKDWCGGQRRAERSVSPESGESKATYGLKSGKERQKEEKPYGKGLSETHSSDASGVVSQDDPVETAQEHGEDKKESQDGRETRDGELMKEVARLVKEEFARVFSLKLVNSRGPAHTTLLNDSVSEF
ncbi:Strongly similar to lipoyltransferase, related [Neospora caninum Liverpool]|uniref:Strongly similar to lipoyltransferase, related n=1 Tax=Neospora caninum (strain Liverpool) TaxID=572307 RepID=F0VNW3_NEOCL|nr:Strongly similar to lipoyltransferase, related [Neospora caninum Liverpool]CBZ55409.1 Strongly similar to lipoyltransferase, related [Neospora caninum Liverpool]|eukprot:XP_003885437.1 Strongly similar to lipoyltransferase, related [Neospora caninum Liverpool]